MNTLLTLSFMISWNIIGWMLWTLTYHYDQEHENKSMITPVLGTPTTGTLTKITGPVIVTEFYKEP